MSNKNIKEFSVNYGTIESRPKNLKSKQNALRHRMCFILFLLSILIISLLFIIGSFLNFYLPHKYEAFHDVEISSRVDLDTYLPIVDYKLKKSKIGLQVKVVQKIESKKVSYLDQFDKLIENIFKSHYYESNIKKNSMLELDTKLFDFNVYKIDSKHSKYQDITCTNISIVNKPKKNVDNTEVCLQLYGYPWFGGHESLVLLF